jgi:peptidoglycan/xylan/chitin deacetylase (PgdA/CDA1 family)
MKARAFLRSVCLQLLLPQLERHRLLCNGIILMFHQVQEDYDRELATGSTAKFLESVIVELRRENWDIVSLDEALSRLGNGDPSRRFAALTFDDGYRDTLTRALPILERHRAPFTVYVPTGAPTRALYSWWLALRTLFQRHDSVAIAAMERQFDCATIESKTTGYTQANQWVHEDYGRASKLAETFRAYDISPAALNDAYFMDEAELRTLARHPLVTVGAHTTSHAALSALAENQARAEMADNRRYLECLLDRSVVHFAYPFGGDAACGEREARLAAEAGFASAVTTHWGAIFAAHRKRPHWLPRVWMGGGDDSRGFKAAIRGLRNAVGIRQNASIR